MPYIALVALALGAFSGARALMDPDWVAGLLKLQAAPDRPGGYAEFRATFGGLFLAIHIVAIALVVTTQPIVAAIVCTVVAAGWLGAAAGRLVSMAVDGQRNGTGGINRIWTGLELVVGLMLLSAWLHVS